MQNSRLLQTPFLAACCCNSRFYDASDCFAFSIWSIRYIKEFLQNFVEFNPNLENVAPSQEIECLKNEAVAYQAKIKDLTAKNKQLKRDLALTKQQLKDAQKQYEYLLGQYQVEVGNKIIHF